MFISPWSENDGNIRVDRARKHSVLTFCPVRKNLNSQSELHPPFSVKAEVCITHSKGAVMSYREAEDLSAVLTSVVIRCRLRLIGQLCMARGYTC